MHHHKQALIVFAIAGAIMGSSTGNLFSDERADAARPGIGPLTVSNFKRDWRFAKGDLEAAEAADFDDATWKPVSLPHDWAIAGPFNPQEHGFAAKLPWSGVGWYRKDFMLDGPHVGESLRDSQSRFGETRLRDRRVYLDFDGVMAFPQVYVNGKLAGGWDYGYMSFRVDATPYVKFGERNVVAVCVDTRKHGTRWYPGAGIYRKVMLTVTNPVHIAHWGTYITTPEVSDSAATVRIRTTLENHENAVALVTVQTAIISPDGQTVASGVTIGDIRAGGSDVFESNLTVANPERWDIMSPNLYTCKTTVRVGESIVDQESTTFGIRTFKFTADVEFDLMERDRFVAGEFVWTGFDYLGEPTPFDQDAEAHTSASSTCAACRRTATSCIAATGGPTCRRSTSCRIGTGRIALEKLCPCSFTRTAIARSCFSTANRWAGATRSRLCPSMPAATGTTLSPTSIDSNGWTSSTNRAN